MAKKIINTGTVPNDGTGDTLRTGGGKINDNFTELYDSKSSIESQLNSIQFEGVKTYDTLSDLQSVSPIPENGTSAKVANDSTPSNNGFYYVSSGVWVKSDFQYVDVISNQIIEGDKKFTNLVELNGGFDAINDVNSLVGVENVANFAGQTNYGNEPIGSILHHYTDGTVRQIDNVGEGNDILVLKNANNPSRRTDKPSDFYGTGNFLKMLKQEGTDPSDRIFIMTALGEFIFGETVNPKFITDKENSGYGFMFEAYKNLTYPWGVSVQGDVIFELVNLSSGRVSLRSTANKPNGIRLETSSGSVELAPEGTSVLFALPNGNVGIGTLLPSEALDVVGNVKVSGTVTGTEFIPTSDERLKENIQEIQLDSLNVDWKEFNMKADSTEQVRYGTTAQDLQAKGYGQFVREIDEEGHMGVNYTDLLSAHAHFVDKYIKDLQSKVIELEQRLETLENK